MRHENVIGNTLSVITYTPQLNFRGIVLLQRIKKTNIPELYKVCSVRSEVKNKYVIVFDIMTELKVQMKEMITKDRKF